MGLIDGEFFEGKILHTSAKSYITEFAEGGKYAVPFSQIITMSQPDADGWVEFCVKSWWWDRKTPLEDK